MHETRSRSSSLFPAWLILGTRESKSDGGRERRNRDSEKVEMLSEQILARRKSCIGEILPTLRGSKPKTSVSPSISQSIYEYFSEVVSAKNKCTRYNQSISKYSYSFHKLKISALHTPLRQIWSLCKKRRKQSIFLDAI